MEKAVLYSGGKAVPWDGLVGVYDDETNEIVNDYYMEPRRLKLSPTAGDLKASLTAFTFPDLFAECCGLGSRDVHSRFGLCFNHIDDDGERTRLIYGAIVEKDKSDETLFRWDISAVKIPIPGAMPSASLTLEHVPPALQDVLYGTEASAPRLPSPEEVISFYKA